MQGGVAHHAALADLLAPGLELRLDQADEAASRCGARAVVLVAGEEKSSELLLRIALANLMLTHHGADLGKQAPARILQ